MIDLNKQTTLRQGLTSKDYWFTGGCSIMMDGNSGGCGGLGCGGGCGSGCGGGCGGCGGCG